MQAWWTLLRLPILASCCTIFFLFLFFNIKAFFFCPSSFTMEVGERACIVVRSKRKNENRGNIEETNRERRRETCIEEPDIEARWRIEELARHTCILFTLVISLTKGKKTHSLNGATELDPWKEAIHTKNPNAEKSRLTWGGKVEETWGWDKRGPWRAQWRALLRACSPCNSACNFIT